MAALATAGVPRFHLIAAPSTSSPFIWTKTADHLRGSAGDKLGLVRRDGPAYLPRYASSAALCGETDPRTRLGTPRPRLCAERRTPVPASVRLVRGFVRRDGPPSPPRYASSAALCGETHPVPALRRHIRGFVRRDAPPPRLPPPHPRLCAESRTPPTTSP